jgi:hypothetical protein
MPDRNPTGSVQQKIKGVQHPLLSRGLGPWRSINFLFPIEHAVFM